MFPTKQKKKRNSIWKKVFLAYPHTCLEEQKEITLLIDNAAANIHSRHLPNTTSNMKRFLFFWDTVTHQCGPVTDRTTFQDNMAVLRESHIDVATQPR
jgi:hypothetical protein